MTSNMALVRRARALTPNLPETVESPLLAFVEQGEAASLAEDRRIAEYCAAHDAFVERHGTFADEFRRVQRALNVGAVRLSPSGARQWFRPAAIHEPASSALGSFVASLSGEASTILNVLDAIIGQALL